MPQDTKANPPSSLSTVYYTLKSTVLSKNGIDVTKYSKLTDHLKKLSAAASTFNITNKAKVFTAKDVDKFLKEAPDYNFLSAKVALIFAICGACGREQLTHITTKDIEQHGEMLIVNVTNTRNRVPRKFVIHGEYYEIVKKYEALRPKKTRNDRFFQTYHNGKCTDAPIGVNTFGGMPKKIAKYLGLPDAEFYNGYSFKKTSAAMLGKLPRARYDPLVADSIRSKRAKSFTAKPSSEACSEPRQSVPLEVTLPPPPINDKSNPDQDPFSSRENTMSPPFINVKINPESRPSSPCENTNENVQNFTQTFQMPGKNVTYSFDNCHFTNCFRKQVP